jgi:hypothetical protein
MEKYGKFKEPKCNEFIEAAKPLIKFLNEKGHPHMTAIITCTSAELMEGLCADSKIYDYVKD